MKPPVYTEPSDTFSPARRQRERSGWRWIRLSTHSDTRAVQIGVVSTVLLHGLLLVFAPQIEQLLTPSPAELVTEDWATQDYQVEFTPLAVPVTPESTEPPSLSLPQFVEANPNAPDNVPDKTDLISAQNQQVAQPSPTPEGKSDSPASQGDPTTTSSVLVNGQYAESRPASVQPLTPPASATTPSPPTTPTSDSPPTLVQDVARRAHSPLPGAELFQGDSPSGYGTRVAPVAPGAAAAVTERIEGLADGKTDTGSRTGLYYKVDPKRPQARATLPSNLNRGRASPLADRPLGTENIGAVAYNAKWSPYGEYMQKLIETVDSQWQAILEQSKVYPTSGTKVTVVFRLDAKGEIAEIVNVSGGGGRSAQDACVSTIVARAPYGAWSADMIGVLGNSQEITFSFFYN